MYRTDSLEISRQEATTQYLRYADAGTVALLVFIGAALIGDGILKVDADSVSGKIIHGVQMFSAFTLFVALVTLFKKSLRDEFLEGLWNAGTAAGFVAGVCYEYAVGIIAGALADYGRANGKIVADWFDLRSGDGIVVAVVVFFIAFQIKRWKIS